MKGKHEMGRRFAIVIGVAAAGVMALGAQTAAAAPDVVKYDTKLTLTNERGFLFHGSVISEVRECMDGRRVVLFKRRPGADRKVGTDRSQWQDGEGVWGFIKFHGGGAPLGGGRVYAKVKPKVRDRFVCRADRAKFHL